jgi:DNA repair protein RecN (Recombination protein N)
VSLKRITLRDFVIISQLELELSGGFTVLTGETGAGKSILIDALQLALGARSDTGLIREGAARTEVSVEFDGTERLSPWLDEAGFEVSELLLLRRTIDAQGKSRAWINGSPATAAQLRELGDQLVDIHGQHAWQSLTRPDTVRGLLDAYGGVSTTRLSGLWERWRDAQQMLAQARKAQDSLSSERDRLSWQIGEVEKLEPGQSEWEDLCAAHTRLANAQTLLDAAQSALAALEDDDNGALSRLAQAHEALRASEHLEPEFKSLTDLLASVLAQSQDTAHTLRSYQRNTDLDPEGLAQLDARMSLWMSLARRYKRAPEDLAQLLLSWRVELATLNASADLGALEQAQSVALAAFGAEARNITQARSAAAPRLARAITQAMQGLGMQGGRFEVQLQALEQPTSSGLEDVCFLVAGHAGTSPRPVSKVASGGELSRIALAIAVTTSQLGSAQTLIFDEVDAGVGGAVAQTVGRLMRQLGRDRQVLAVTHLPQVAACGDQHLVVAKQRQGATTVSTVTLVAGPQRENEIARMLGGQELSDTSRAHAREMLGSQT